jgi:O-methyltransferase
VRPPVVPALKTAAKRIAAPWLYAQPVSSLQPERLYAYLDALWRRREIEGDVVEIGCWLGGTAAIAYKLLVRTGYAKRYVCVDTFGGFVAEQFDRDVGHGTPSRYRSQFSANSVDIVRRLLRRYGCEEIELVQGDIAALDEDMLPDHVSVCLVDVDPEVPVYESLRRIYPRLVPGGVILVDDCPPGYAWAGSRVGYRRFVADHGLPERYFMDMGVVESPGAAAGGGPA